MTQTTPSNPEVLSLNEAMSMLRMRRHTIVDLAKRGELPGRKVGREWRFPRAKLLRWLEGPSVRHAR